MKRLNELFNNINSDCSVNGIKINSKEVKEGDIFVCTMGVTADRHDFIDDAIKHGAAAIIVSRDVGEKSADYFYPISIIEKEKILDKKHYWLGSWIYSNITWFYYFTFNEE